MFVTEKHFKNPKKRVDLLLITQPPLDVQKGVVIVCLLQCTPLQLNKILSFWFAGGFFFGGGGYVAF